MYKMQNIEMELDWILSRKLKCRIDHEAKVHIAVLWRFLACPMATN